KHERQLFQASVNLQKGKVTFDKYTFDCYTRPAISRRKFYEQAAKAVPISPKFSLRIDYRSKVLSDEAKEEQLLKNVLEFHQQSVGDQPAVRDPERKYKPPAQPKSQSNVHDPSSSQEYLATHTGVYTKTIPLRTRIIHLLALNKYKLKPIAEILREDPAQIIQELASIADEENGVYRLKLLHYLEVEVADFPDYIHKDRIKATINCHTAFNLARLPGNISQRRALDPFYKEAGIKPDPIFAIPEAEVKPAQSQPKASSARRPQKVSSPTNPSPYARPQPAARARKTPTPPPKSKVPKPARPVVRTKIADQAPSPVDKVEVKKTKLVRARTVARTKIADQAPSPVDKVEVKKTKPVRSRPEPEPSCASPIKRQKKISRAQVEEPEVMQRQSSRIPAEVPRAMQRQPSRAQADDPSKGKQRRSEAASRPAKTSLPALDPKLSSMLRKFGKTKCEYEELRGFFVRHKGRFNELMSQLRASNDGALLKELKRRAEVLKGSKDSERFMGERKHLESLYTELGAQKKAILEFR
ncbi:hypothetical protein L0F63_003999, partial [Massospora cicadina]